MNSILEQYEKHWPTTIGKAFLCDRVVLHGQDLHHQLGSWEWFKLYCFSFMRREIPDNQLKLLNFFWVATSYPDPSIWPNHIVALAGTTRSTASLALMAGLSVSEASIYGRRPEKRALDFFYRSQQAIENGQTLEQVIQTELAQGRTIYGYGRPLAKLDERIPHTLALARELGLAEGKHLQLALAVYRYLKQSKGLSMNIAAIDAALAADIGLSPEEYQLFMSPCFIAGMTPCYLDGRDKPEGAFFPMRCSSVQYHGVTRREWA